MKRKTIGKIISGKVSAWLKTVDDKELSQGVRKSVVVTGGAIASMFLGEEPKDYDIYLQDREVARRLVEYYIKKFKSLNPKSRRQISVVDGVPEDNGLAIVIASEGVASSDSIAADDQSIEKHFDDAQGDSQQKESSRCKKYDPQFLSQNAITLSGDIQIVLRFCGSPEFLHGNYDFVHCTNYWTNAEGVVTNKEALEALLTKELRYVGSKFPICSVMRLRKFLSRGWTINAGQVLKMAMQVSELDLTDPKVLERQLTGVDAAYFSQLIEEVRERNPDAVDSSYVVEVIERIWG